MGLSVTFQALSWGNMKSIHGKDSTHVLVEMPCLPIIEAGAQNYNSLGGNPPRPPHALIDSP